MRDRGWRGARRVGRRRRGDPHRRPGRRPVRRRTAGNAAHQRRAGAGAGRDRHGRAVVVGAARQPRHQPAGPADPGAGWLPHAGRACSADPARSADSRSADPASSAGPASSADPASDTRPAAAHLHVPRNAVPVRAAGARISAVQDRDPSERPGCRSGRLRPVGRRALGRAPVRSCPSVPARLRPGACRHRALHLRQHPGRRLRGGPGRETWSSAAARPVTVSSSGRYSANGLRCSPPASRGAGSGSAVRLEPVRATAGLPSRP